MEALTEGQIALKTMPQDTLYELVENGILKMLPRKVYVEGKYSATYNVFILKDGKEVMRRFK